MKLRILITSLFLTCAVQAEVYEFKSSFAPEKSDVSYSGQVLRQTLISDLKKEMGGHKKGAYEGDHIDASAIINSYINYNWEGIEGPVEVIDGYTPFWTQDYLSIDLVPLKVFAKDPEDKSSVTRFEVFGDSSKNLMSKLAGVDKTLFDGKKFLGFGEDYQTPQEFLEHQVELLGKEMSEGRSFTVEVSVEGRLKRVNEAHVLRNGWDLNQLTNKFLHGALSFSQAAGDYMSLGLGKGKGLQADNGQPSKPGKPYTALAHHWDEAFGYFGASRHYGLMEDEDIVIKVNGKNEYPVYDANEDKMADLNSEVNFGLSINAAKRDLEFLGSENFTENIFGLFLEGRKIISTQGQEVNRDQLAEMANKLLLEWERLFAANALHYVKKTVCEMNKFYSPSGYTPQLLAKFWGELKGFALAFQFNPNSPMSVDEFKELHTLIGYELPFNQRGQLTLKQNLKIVKNKLVEKYDFDHTVVDQIMGGCL